MSALAHIYSVLICVDHVEHAYTNKSISADLYTRTINDLLSEYSSLIESPEFETRFDGIDAFCKQFQVKADLGIERVRIGVPSVSSKTTSKPASSNQSNARALLKVAETFITFNDGIHLGYRSKQELHPLLADLAISLNAVHKGDFAGRRAIVEWLTKLNKLKVNEQLSNEEAAVCLSDIEAAYDLFQQSL